jgi:hypothetical protein
VRVEVLVVVVVVVVTFPVLRDVTLCCWYVVSDVLEHLGAFILKIRKMNKTFS